MEALECSIASFKEEQPGGGRRRGGAGFALDSSEERSFRSRYRRRLLFANVQSFAHRTSAHGLGRFFSQQIPWLRLLWCLVVMGALTGLTLHTYKQVSLFRDYPVSSTTRLLTNRFSFPDVTFCDPLMKKFLTKGSSEVRRDVDIKNYFSLSYMLGYNFSTGASAEETKVKAIKIAYSSFEHAVHSWPEFNMTEVSARILDMLVYCQYNQEPCSEENFTVFYHRDYGNCFSFKATNRTMKSSGVEKGLVLVLYSPSVDIIQNNDYYSDIVTTGLETGGLRVVVHQKDTIPYPSEYGINSPSGMQTVLALSQVQTSLANTPTKRCEPRGTFYAFDHLLRKTQSYEKQLADCTTFEHLKSVQEKCGCTIEGLLQTRPNSTPSVNFCHDLLGAQRREHLIPLLRQFVSFFGSDRQTLRYGLLSNATKTISMGKFRQMRIDDKLHIVGRLVDNFPFVERRLRQLRCALPYLKSGRKQSNCLNICKYTTYDFSVFQSRWPDLSFQIRGARIRLARITKMLQQRVNAIDRAMRLNGVAGADANHALNHSIAEHRINLTRCLESQLNRSTNSFKNDSHCKKVHNIVRQSFLQLRVYPKTLTVRQLFEERSYELVNLFSDLGGIMGLWIGVSMVTLCEFAEILLIVVSYYLRSVVRKLSRLADEEAERQRCKRPAAACQNHVGNSNHLSLVGAVARRSNHNDASQQQQQQQQQGNPCAYQQPRLQPRRPGGRWSDSPWNEVQLPLLPPPPSAAGVGGFGDSSLSFENRFSLGSTSVASAVASAAAGGGVGRRRQKRPTPESPTTTTTTTPPPPASVLCNKETQL